MKAQSWQLYLMAQGLFFSGLAIGILGETWRKQTHTISWVLLGIGVASLVLSALLWALRVQKQLAKRPRVARIPKPINLEDNFKRLIQGQGHVDLMTGLRFQTQSRILLSSRERIELEAEHEAIVEHLEGCELQVYVDDEQVTSLSAGDVVRIPFWHEARLITVAEAEDTEGVNDRAPRVLLHKINCKESE